MAKITVAGDAVVVTSSMKLEDLKTIQKYRPEALVLRGGEDGKEELFRICVTDGAGDVNKYGASFGRKAPDDSGLATITMCYDAPAGTNIKEAVADSIGYAVNKLNAIEGSLPTVLAQITAEKAAIMENITVAQ